MINAILFVYDGNVIVVTRNSDGRVVGSPGKKRTLDCHGHKG